ncbi:hypothetical protein; putative exported protein [Xenorhabdus bovienii str. kraussei Quebec]|uniref:Uncharacterized protein n=1 Tax=Xenorhabdus bovienii str. kraussei Quebec TaxID=1398203 RepID=A0A077PM54_XENBV|nr:hypothetical protein; putative exported protein [Xenorhabdus bovienii str. kraussei Quebec]
MSLLSSNSPLSVTLTAGTGCPTVMLWANANTEVKLSIADKTMFFIIFIP